MTTGDDRARRIATYLRGLASDAVGHAFTFSRADGAACAEAAALIEDGIAAREDAERAHAALRAVEALVIEADAAHVQYLAGPILDRFIVPANVTTERIRTAIRDALEAR